MTYKSAQLAIAALLFAAPAISAQVRSAGDAGASAVQRTEPVRRVQANPMEQLIRESETAGLSEAQLDSVASHNAAYLKVAAKEWDAYNEFVQAAPVTIDAMTLVARAHQTQAAIKVVLDQEVAAVRGILSEQQMNSLSPALQSLLEGNPLRR